MAPEVLNGQQYNKSVDWWAIGIMLYELLFGRNPFNLEDEDQNVQEFKEAVEENDLLFPDREQYDIEYSNELMDLIQKLLTKDRSKRIDFEQIKNHKWFKGSNWD